MVPYPFARMVLVVGEPLRAGPAHGRARNDERETLRAELERRLRLATAEADRLAGRAVVEET